MAMSLSQAKIPAVEWQMNPICNLMAGTLLQEIHKVQEWLERKRISFLHEDELSNVFYGKDMLNFILAVFDSVQDVYFMLKEAL